MRIHSSDEAMSVDVGMGSIWRSLYSTAFVTLPDDERDKMALAFDFLQNGTCATQDAATVLAQIEVIKERLSMLMPEEAVYDLDHPDMLPPWKGYIAETVTSCADLYTTADGKDLLTETIRLLGYSASSGSSIDVC